VVGENAVDGVERAMAGHLALLQRVTFVVQPPLTIFTRQSLFLGSRHPLRMVVPSRVTLHPCWWKKTSHPVLQRTATKRRLLMKLGRWWASRALGGSAWSRRLMAWVEVILASLGWRTVIWTLVVIALLAGALVVSSKTEATVSMRAVASKLVGLVQLDVRLIELTSCELTTTANFDSAGMTCQVGGLE
jgi:hypothetical protein